MSSTTSLKRIAFLILSISLFNSCISTARFRDFPKTSYTIDFSKDNERYKGLKNMRSANEYYIEMPVAITEAGLIRIIHEALTDGSHKIVKTDTENDCVFAKRGLRPNEWNSKTGVYYHIDHEQSIVHVYILTRITQDFTGSFRGNRAEKIGLRIKEQLEAINQDSSAI